MKKILTTKLCTTRSAKKSRNLSISFKFSALGSKRSFLPNKKVANCATNVWGSLDTRKYLTSREKKKGWRIFLTKLLAKSKKWRKKKSWRWITFMEQKAITGVSIWQYQITWAQEIKKEAFLNHNPSVWLKTSLFLELAKNQCNNHFKILPFLDFSQNFYTPINLLLTLISKPRI